MPTVYTQIHLGNRAAWENVFKVQNWGGGGVGEMREGHGLREEARRGS